MGRSKRRVRNVKRSPPTGQSFMQNPDPTKTPRIFVPVDEEEYSDDDPVIHYYESEGCDSIGSESDDDQSTAYPQGNFDAPIGQVRQEVGMEFEMLASFKKAVRKYNIAIGRSVFFP
ncbi:hypothetical protein S83_069495 [Arachis hypogaea]|nr:uncharacterized protein DS421_20g685690 [Arachis hypogaea]